MEQDYTRLDEAARKAGCGVLRDEPMSGHTTFRIGGPADRFITVSNVRQLSAVLRALEEGDIPRLVVGNGSDLLVSDRGIRGAVLCLTGDFEEVKLLSDGRTVRAGAGAPISVVCAFAGDRGLTGLEFAWGIPGSTGGAVYMNAGAYGGEMKDVVGSVVHMAPDGEIVPVAGEQMGFAYRRSRYTGGRDVILYADLVLRQGDRMLVWGKMEELLARRRAKQPLDMPSAGSVFKRPGDGYAAELIEGCGLKGRSVGGARVSDRHAGFIVNTGGATCSDVLTLINIIQETVYEKTGIKLEREVLLAGEM